jgi:hypothetical protein
MKYREFNAPDPEKARENWSLLDSAAATGEPESGPHSSTSPHPVMRPEAYRERIAELRARPLPAALQPEPATEPVFCESAAPAAENAAPAGTPLRKLFSRLSGDEQERPPGPPAGETAPVPVTSPLSQVFKRLT